MPKRGFSNARFRPGFLSVNVGRLADHFEAGAILDRSHLVSAGLVPDRKGIVKVLANGEINKALHLKGITASAAARAKLEAAGGSVQATA
jgi:large subunit ribosomal protein L15